MPEHNTQEHHQNKEQAAPVVERNGVSMTLSKETFGGKSPNKGKTFWTPKFSTASLDTGLKWFGEEMVANIMTRAARKIFGDIAVDESNLNTDGTVNMEAIHKDWADFTAGVAKLSDLEDEMTAIQDQLSACVQNENFGATDDDGKPTEAAVELADQMRELNASARSLRQQIKVISDKYQERVQKRKAAQAAKELEAAKAKAASAGLATA